MTDLLLNMLIPIALVIFTARRLLTYLHAYQQEEYDSRLFLRWLFSKRVFDKRLTLTLFIISLLLFVLPAPSWLPVALLIAAFLIFALREPDPRQRSKKKLVMTQRAKRIFALALLFNAVVAVGAAFPHVPLFWIIPVQLIPFTLVIANLALQPLEEMIQQKYWREAHDKILQLKPKVIGITGSFGKTSVKHILGHILQSAAPTLVTPGSVNTPMGVTRIIREQLAARHKYFVVEMGAYGPGSIERLCRLTPPDFGVITAIGHAHYERFKDLETVAGAKYELAEAVKAKGGAITVHEGTLSFKHPQTILKNRPDLFTIVGHGEEAHLRILETRQRESGVQVDVKWQGEPYMLEAPLYGAHHGSNMALAFGIACNLGLPIKHILTALKSTPQIAHRLEVKPRGKGGLLIDDAYNSNPSGFQAALDLLDTIANGRRRILITPGMVELGAAHEEKHAELGTLAAAKTDVTIAVQPERIRSFVKAFKDAKPETGQLVEVSSFAEAQAWLAEHGRDDDVILLENDLPDVYENVPQL